MKHRRFSHLYAVSISIAIILQTSLAQTDFWVPISAPYNGDVRSMTFTHSGVTIAGTYGGGIWRSTNDGQSWSINNTGIGNYYIFGLATAPNGNVFAVVGSGLERSSNEGVSWGFVLVSSSEFRCLAISKAVQSSGTIFAGSTNGVTHSTDNGTSWSSFQMFNVAPIIALAVGPTGIVYAASTSYGIYRSTDNGASWEQTSLALGTFVSLATNPAGNVFAATYASVYRTLDSGSSWQQVVITNVDVKSVAVAPNGHVFAALNTAGVYRSTNNGTIWDSINTGLTNRYGALVGVNSTGYAYAVAGGRLFRSTGPVTAMYPSLPSLPASLTLHQNYPNPFNPTTQIRFDLSEASHVALTVFDVLGRNIAELASGFYGPGYHSATWETVGKAGEPASSGVYFARLSVTDVSGRLVFVGTNKLLLMK